MNWSVLGSRYLIRDRWLTVRADSCRTAGGRVVEPYYVLEYTDWVSIVALTDADEALLVRQYRHGIGRAILELPGGCVDAEDGSPLEAARRELREETGYDCAQLTLCGVLSANPATHSNQTHCFLATGCRRVGEPTLDEGEELELVRVPAAELIEHARRGELPQSLHVASVFLAMAELGRLQP